mgnify:CR=1 FL=1
MSYKYLALKRLASSMQLGLTPLAIKEFGILPLAVWLLNTRLHYTTVNYNSEFSDEAAQFLKEHDAYVTSELGKLMKPGRLFLDAVLHFCKMPVCGDLDKNLKTIAAAIHHAEQMDKRPVEKLSIKYSLKKHRDDRNLRLMTVRGDVLGDFGMESAGLCLSALTQAISREMGLKIHIWNTHEVFGDEHGKSRVAPEYAESSMFLARFMFIDYVCKIFTVEQVKDNYGVIKVICDYYKTLEVPKK